MYGIFVYIQELNQIYNIDRDSSPMDAMGNGLPLKNMLPPGMIFERIKF